MNLKAIIFDFNGTVISDEEVYSWAFKKILKDLGAGKVADEVYIGGIGIKENWPILIEKYSLKTSKSAEELAALTHEQYLQHVADVEIKSGFVSLAEEARSKSLLIGLATSNIWNVVDEVFKNLGLSKYFDCITTGEEVIHKKPAPDIFLVTAEKMIVEPENCVVFEDSKSGIEAARSAGMRSVGLYRGSKHKRELEKADLLISEFSQTSVADLTEL